MSVTTEYEPRCVCGHFWWQHAAKKRPLNDHGVPVDYIFEGIHCRPGCPCEKFVRRPQGLDLLDLMKEIG